MEKKTALLLAGGGTIGTYAALELHKRGFEVEIICMNEPSLDVEGISYRIDKIDDDVLKDVFARKRYNLIIDFLHYDIIEEYEPRAKFLLANCDHMIFLSSYRVYADLQHPITEDAPQLLDVTDDKVLLENETYGLNKSRCEKILKSLPEKHWTAVRPLISFSSKRFDIITTQGSMIIGRTKAGKKILVPVDAKNVVAGFGWSGNAGKLIAGLALNKRAYGEAFTIGSGESRTWGEIAEYYEEFIGAKFVWVDTQKYLEVATPNQVGDTWGLKYDRLCDRTIDASKLLSVTGIKYEELTSIKDALRYELGQIPENAVFAERLGPEVVARISKQVDDYIAENNL
ncbi:MAG: hypothetical protein IKU43_10905 [Clostridia bacterium]|nr:hypothetical protein [Clostridia bacterium]